MLVHLPRSVLIGTVMLFIGLSLVDPVMATSPCPPDPCRNSDGSFNQVGCRSTADWIAIGTIAIVKNNWQGHPLNKNFAVFNFFPTEWEKGEQKDKEYFQFTVGWCDNSMELPELARGKFKFYGRNALNHDGKAVYLGFQKLK